MAERKAARKVAEKSTKKASGTAGASRALTPEERAAIREHVKELKAAAENQDLEKAVLAKIAEMAPADRAMAKRIHAIVKASAPVLSPRLWYGMPAYSRDGNVICFFQPSQKFKTRYSTFGFNDRAHLDEGVMWPVAYALKDLTGAEEARLAALVKKAVS